MKRLFGFLFVFLLAVVLTACKPKEKDTPPRLEGVDTAYVKVGNEFDPLEGVKAIDAKDGDITDKIVVNDADKVDTNTKGTYTVTYEVENSRGKKTSVQRLVKVDDYADGEYNFRFASDDLRHQLFAAAERYLLETLAGGIPLFANSGFVMYSERMVLPVDNYVPVIGYGAIFGTMSKDDAETFGGNEGEYTYRVAITSSPKTLNHWQYQDSVESDLMSLYLDALYVYVFNDEKTGYELVPSMATDYPEPVNPRPVDDNDPNSLEVSKKWRVTIRTDLEWKYHPNTDTSSFPEGHEKIKAQDFINTFKLALDENWFRATSGGGDFLSKPQAIKNAEKYVNKQAEWDEVGLKAVDDYTLEFEFVDDMSEWDVRYWLGSFVLTPINLHLYEALETADGNRYGTDEKTIAYTGPYYIEYYEHDKEIRLAKNEKFHSPDMYFYDKIRHPIIEDSTVRFQEFIEGNLDAASLPTDQYDQYKGDPRLKRVPGATTFRMVFNGFGTTANQIKVFPDSNYVPEPLLANKNFQKAMYYIIDREHLARNVMKTSDPNAYHFTSAYLVNARSGIAFRDTEWGKKVGEGLGINDQTHGYNESLALEYWKKAIEELIDQGVYKDGDTITLDLVYQAGSASLAAFGNYLKDLFESKFTYKKIKVVVELNPQPFPNNYTEYLQIAEFDLGVGGISGSTLDASSFLDVYSSDNRSGFTLNWGIDTSIPEIEIEYEHPTKGKVREIWSYDALVSALNGTVTVKNGQEVKTE